MRLRGDDAWIPASVSLHGNDVLEHNKLFRKNYTSHMLLSCIFTREQYDRNGDRLLESPYPDRSFAAEVPLLQN